MTEKDNRREEQHILRVKELFLSETGKQLIQDLCQEFHVFEGTYNDNPHKMAFLEGQRSVIWYLIQVAEVPLDELRQAWRSQKIDQLDPRL